MKKIVPLLLTLLLAFPVLAQYAPQMKDQAIMAMSETPLVGMDKESSLFIAAYSYECAAYYIGMTVIATKLYERGDLGEDFGSLEEFTRAGQQVGAYHIALAEIIHIIYDITEEQDMTIMLEQNEKIKKAINDVHPKDLDDKYEVPCQAVLKTYLPILFAEEEKNGA